ncbi:hypothetical protein [Plantactinospora sp. WMMB782]|uniref:hypothetical protein n=1 Tax=Plantactinospora sp. WMMB782 TaxID=3404121 RepID=UPI003B92B63E
MRGDGPDPVLVLAAVRALPDTSLTAALSAGGRDHYGWGVDRHLRANLFDALNLNTRASGHWGKKPPPKFPEFPRPKSKPKKSAEPKQKVTVRDVFRRLTNRG